VRWLRLGLGVHMGVGIGLGGIGKERKVAVGVRRGRLGEHAVS